MDSQLWKIILVFFIQTFLCRGQFQWYIPAQQQHFVFPRAIPLQQTPNNLLVAGQTPVHPANNVFFGYPVTAPSQVTSPKPATLSNSIIYGQNKAPNPNSNTPANTNNQQNPTDLLYTVQPRSNFYYSYPTTSPFQVTTPKPDTVTNNQNNGWNPITQAHIITNNVVQQNPTDLLYTGQPLVQPTNNLYHSVTSPSQVTSSKPPTVTTNAQNKVGSANVETSTNNWVYVYGKNGSHPIIRKVLGGPLRLTVHLSDEKVQERNRQKSILSEQLPQVLKDRSKMIKQYQVNRVNLARELELNKIAQNNILQRIYESQSAGIPIEEDITRYLIQLQENRKVLTKVAKQNRETMASELKQALESVLDNETKRRRTTDTKPETPSDAESKVVEKSVDMQKQKQQQYKQQHEIVRQRKPNYFLPVQPSIAHIRQNKPKEALDTRNIQEQRKVEDQYTIKRNRFGRPIYINSEEQDKPKFLQHQLEQSSDNNFKEKDNPEELLQERYKQQQRIVEQQRYEQIPTFNMEEQHYPKESSQQRITQQSQFVRPTYINFEEQGKPEYSLKYQSAQSSNNNFEQQDKPENLLQESYRTLQRLAEQQRYEQMPKYNMEEQDYPEGSSQQRDAQQQRITKQNQFVRPTYINFEQQDKPEDSIQLRPLQSSSNKYDQEDEPEKLLQESYSQLQRIAEQQRYKHIPTYNRAEQNYPEESSYQRDDPHLRITQQNQFVRPSYINFEKQRNPEDSIQHQLTQSSNNNFEQQDKPENLLQESYRQQQRIAEQQIYVPTFNLEKPDYPEESLQQRDGYQQKRVKQDQLLRPSDVGLEKQDSPKDLLKYQFVQPSNNKFQEPHEQKKPLREMYEEQQRDVNVHRVEQLSNVNYKLQDELEEALQETYIQQQKMHDQQQKMHNQQQKMHNQQQKMHNQQQQMHNQRQFSQPMIASYVNDNEESQDAIQPKYLITGIPDRSDGRNTNVNRQQKTKSSLIGMTNDAEQNPDKAQDTFIEDERQRSNDDVLMPITVLTEYLPSSTEKPANRQKTSQSGLHQPLRTLHRRPDIFIHPHEYKKHVSQLLRQDIPTQQTPTNDNNKEGKAFKQNNNEGENYEFGFAVEDDRESTYFTRSEKRDGDQVNGSYSVYDPDGYIRKVIYTADSKTGFRAKVIREPVPVKKPKQSPPHALLQVRDIIKNLPDATSPEQELFKSLPQSPDQQVKRDAEQEDREIKPIYWRYPHPTGITYWKYIPPGARQHRRHLENHFRILPRHNYA